MPFLNRTSAKTTVLTAWFPQDHCDQIYCTLYSSTHTERELDLESRALIGLLHIATSACRQWYTQGIHQAWLWLGFEPRSQDLHAETVAATYPLSYLVKDTERPQLVPPDTNYFNQKQLDGTGESQSECFLFSVLTLLDMNDNTCVIPQWNFCQDHCSHSLVPPISLWPELLYTVQQYTYCERVRYRK